MKQLFRLSVATLLVVCCTGACAQIQPSPIDITNNLLVYPRALPQPVFAYPNNAPLQLYNPSVDANGFDHCGVKAIEPPPGMGPIAGATLTLGGEVFNLIQFHFHADAEHVLNGLVYAMEVHLVHQSVLNPNKLVVVGRWIEQREHYDDPLLDFELDKIFGAGVLVPWLLVPPVNLPAFNLNVFLPPVANRESYRYHGSLTTIGQQNVAVDWIVFHEPLIMTNAQVNRFWNFLSLIDHVPPLAPLNPHRPPDGNATPPEPIVGVWPPFKVSTDVMPGPKTDVTGDGQIDFFDALIFLGWWSAGNERADWNGDYSVDFFDVLDYLNDFAAGL